MEGYRRKTRRDTVHSEVSGGQVKEMIEARERLALRNVKDEGHLRDKTLKLRFRVGDLDLPERRQRYTSSRGEEEDAQMCPYGKAVE